jgi:hypothetical protein
MADTSQYTDSSITFNGAQNENAPLPEGDTFIYVIQFGDLDIVKVGIGVSPPARLRALQTGAFMPLRIAAQFGPTSRDCAFAVEQLVHDIMGCRRRTGEWFFVPVSKAAHMVNIHLQYYAELVDFGCPEEFEGGPAKDDFEMECWMASR